MAKECKKCVIPADIPPDYVKCDREALKERIEQLEAELAKLVNMVEGQKKDINGLKARLATIRTLAMGELGKRKAPEWP